MQRIQLTGIDGAIISLPISFLGVMTRFESDGIAETVVHTPNSAAFVVKETLAEIETLAEAAAMNVGGGVSADIKTLAKAARELITIRASLNPHNTKALAFAFRFAEEAGARTAEFAQLAETAERYLQEPGG